MRCATAIDELDLLLSHLCELSASLVCSDLPELAVFGLAAAQNHSYSRRSQFAGDVQGLNRCSLTRAANKPTAEDIGIDESVGCARDLGFSFSSNSSGRAATSGADADGVVALNVWYGNILSVAIPLRVEQIEKPSGA